MLGIGLPWLSSTWTSILTTLVSDLKLASEVASFPFVALGLSFEGIGAGGLSVVSAAGCFRGLATVSLLLPGLSCAHTPTIKVNAAAALRIKVFIRTLPPINDTGNQPPGFGPIRGAGTRACLAWRSTRGRPYPRTR